MPRLIESVTALDTTRLSPHTDWGLSADALLYITGPGGMNKPFRMFVSICKRQTKSDSVPFHRTGIHYLEFIGVS
jgi:hypothetical protein